MATVEGERLTEAFRQQQLALRASTLLDLGRLWALFDVSTPGSYDAFVEAAHGLIRLRHGDSAQLAGAYLRVFRATEGIGGRVPAFARAEAPLLEQVAVVLRATGLAGTVRALRAGKTMRQALASGLVQASGATSRLVMAGGQDRVRAFVEADPLAKGWVRVTSGSPCAFCAMLASRGPTYRSERTARFQAHDHCSCAAAPFYGGQQPLLNLRFRELWRQEGAPHSGAAALRAFRRAYDADGLAPVADLTRAQLED